VKNRKVIFILADAFRYDYINKLDMRFLKKKVDKKERCFYVKKIVPSTGFCEIIEYVTGKETLEHGMFTQITIKEDWYSMDSSTRLLQLVNRVYYQNPFRKIPKIRGIYRILFDSVIDKILLKKNISPEMINVRYNIPLHFLPFLEPTESKYEYDSFDFGGRDNLFVWMREKNISYDIDDFVKHNKVKGTDEDRLNRLKEKIRKRKLKDFTLLYIGYGELAHFYGTESEFFKKKNAYDFIVSVFGIYDSPYPGETLKNIILSLKPNGRAVLVVNERYVEFVKKIDKIEWKVWVVPYVENLVLEVRRKKGNPKFRYPSFVKFAGDFIGNKWGVSESNK